MTFKKDGKSPVASFTKFFDQNGQFLGRIVKNANDPDFLKIKQSIVNYDDSYKIR